MDREAMKHTPGPWVVGRGVVHQIPVASVAMNGLKLNVAHAAGIRDGEGLANARLIAAAPDLLEALQDVCARLLYRGVSTNAGHPDRTALEIARAAIAKATGGEA